MTQLAYIKSIFSAEKIKDFAALTKFRLSALVVFSAAIGYMFGTDNWNILSIAILSLGGMMVTGASNALNEVFERDSDKLMTRTLNRPLPTGRMSLVEGLIIAGLLALCGISLLSVYFNTTTGVLSALSLFTYAFIYTPLKKVSSIAVFVGAIPGALPPMIGYVAAVNSLDYIALLLFGIQFFWQFPHFWSIAWVAFDDYLKAGIMLLPSAGGKNTASSVITLIYTILLLPIGILPYYFNLVGLVGTIVISFSACLMIYYAIYLFKERTDVSARKLMFSSFVYLPLVQLAILFDKI